MSTSQTAAAIQTVIVEDDVSSRKALVQILTMRGIAAVGVSSLAEALAALACRPESVILDLMLPDGNGIEVLRRIRQTGLAIRVAVLSGADKPMIAEAEKLGPEAVFSKPVDMGRLLAWLKGG